METSSREEPEQQAHQPPTDVRVAFGVAVAIQVLALLIMVFGDIGFDRAGRFGLDFGHGLLLALIWVAALAAGFLLAWRARHTGLLSLQTVLLLLTVGGGLLMAWAAGFGEPISPADQQHVPR